MIIGKRRRSEKSYREEDENEDSFNSNESKGSKRSDKEVIFEEEPEPKKKKLVHSYDHKSHNLVYADCDSPKAKVSESKVKASLPSSLQGSMTGEAEQKYLTMIS